MPVAFWYIGLMGGVIIFLYALLRLRDPVMVIGQGAQCAMYLTNIWLIKKASTN